MTQDESFTRAIDQGAAIVGVTTKAPQNPPHTVQADGSRECTVESADEENPVFDVLQHVEALAACIKKCPH